MKNRSVLFGISNRFGRMFCISFCALILAGFCMHDTFGAENELSKKQIKNLSKADNLFAQQKYQKALKNFTKLMADSVINNQIFYKAGLCNYGIKKYPEAINYLEQSMLVADDIIPETEYFLGKCYYFNKEYQEALLHYIKFRKMLTILSQVNQDKSEEYTGLLNALNKEIDHCEIEIKHNLNADLEEEEDTKSYYLLKDEEGSKEIEGSKVLLVDKEDAAIDSNATTYDRSFTFLNLPPDSVSVISLPESITKGVLVSPPANESAEVLLDNDGGNVNEAVETSDSSLAKREIYVVQIGAFRNTPSIDFLTSANNLKSTVTKDGLTRYTVGSFEEKGPAIKLKNDLINIGFKGAFISTIEQKVGANRNE